MGDSPRAKEDRVSDSAKNTMPLACPYSYGRLRGNPGIVGEIGEQIEEIDGAV